MRRRRTQVRPAHRGSHHRLPRVVGNVPDRARGADGRERVVHHAVERSELRDRRVDDRVDVRTDGDVTPQGKRAPAAPFDLGGDRITRLGAARRDDHVRARRRAGEGDAFTDATARTGDHHRLLVEEPVHKPIQIPPSATKVPAVRKCASGAPSISISGARSAAGSPGPPSAGTESETERVNASASSAATQ